MLIFSSDDGCNPTELITSLFYYLGFLLWFDGSQVNQRFTASPVQLWQWLSFLFVSKIDFFTPSNSMSARSKSNDYWWWHLKHHFFCYAEREKHTTSRCENQQTGFYSKDFLSTWVNRLGKGRATDDLTWTKYAGQTMTELLENNSQLRSSRSDLQLTDFTRLSLTLSNPFSMCNLLIQSLSVGVCAVKATKINRQKSQT